MPPPGGYEPINYTRIPAKRLFKGATLFAGYLGITAAATYIYFLTWKEIHRNEIEIRSANFAIMPMLLAERDRAYLKQLRRNRDEEADLMKNVEGWEVGTLYGEPLYKLNKPDTLVEPTYHEYYVHTHYKHMAKRADINMWS